MKKEYERFQTGNLFEGLVSLRALIASAEQFSKNAGLNDRKILEVLYDRERASKEKKEFLWLGHRADELGFSLTLTDRAEIDSLAVGNTHGGILVRCSERSLRKLSTLAPTPNGFYILLEGIEDPYNFGYALRSLYAAGVDGIILGEHNWMTAAGVVCRASAGASEQLPIYLSDGCEAAHFFKSHGYTVVCADLRESIPLYEARLPKPILLIVGGEKRGISRALLSLADIRVSIPYGRPFEASLSAASAATVVAYEILRQNITP